MPSGSCTSCVRVSRCLAPRTSRGETTETRRQNVQVPVDCQRPPDLETALHLQRAFYLELAKDLDLVPALVGQQKKKS